MFIADPPKPASPSLDIQAPLVRYNGHRPPAPHWFELAVAASPEDLRVEADGAALEVLVWGPKSAPPLLLLHGLTAHAGWWRPIAPFLARTHRVVALSFSGMGRSGWRDAYSAETHAGDVRSVIEALDLLGGGPLSIVAHSYGAPPAAKVAAELGDAVELLALLDRPVELQTPLYKPGFRDRGPVYPTLEEALGRFRLQPLQPCENDFFLDLIARESLHEIETPTGRAWGWRADPNLIAKLERRGMSMSPDLSGLSCRLAFLHGETSQVFPLDHVAADRARAPGHAAYVMIPEAGHHLMLDQPIATVAALTSLVTAARAW